MAFGYFHAEVMIHVSQKHEALNCDAGTVNSHLSQAISC